MEFFLCFCEVVVRWDSGRSIKPDEFWPTRWNSEADGRVFFAVAPTEAILLHRRCLMGVIEVLRQELHTRQRY